MLIIIHNKLEYGILLFGGAAAYQSRSLKSSFKKRNSSKDAFKAGP